MWRLINVQGWAGLAASAALLALLILQKGETRHWRKQSAQYERLYRAEQAAFAVTVANYRAAAEAARRSDRENVERVAAEQRAINERTSNDYEARLAAARAAAERLRSPARPAAPDPGRRRATPVPGVPGPSGGAAETAGQNGLSVDDALVATEQAIQLDELIEWVKRQAKVDPNADPRSR